jgi:hypothetical protein
VSGAVLLNLASCASDLLYTTLDYVAEFVADDLADGALDGLTTTEDSGA